MSWREKIIKLILIPDVLSFFGRNKQNIYIAVTQASTLEHNMLNCNVSKSNVCLNEECYYDLFNPAAYIILTY